jgi:two-component system response regulator PilR (NtrC family)
MVPMAGYNILIIDDEKSFRELLEILFADEGYNVFTASDIPSSCEIIKNKKIDIAVCDLVLGNEDGMDIVKWCKQHNHNIPFILMTAYASSSTALESVKLGVVDYVTKPFDMDNLANMVSDVISSREENDDGCCPELDEIKGKSDVINKIKKYIIDVAKTDSTVLITGESGTGKELVARAIHRLSGRSSRAFKAINCSAIPYDLLESELFGYKKGAFTGASYDKKGIFELADGGSIFLDEIGDMPLFLQSKLLRVIQDKIVQPLGAGKEIKTDFRLITATNKNLEDQTKQGNFRSDLYYRLNVVNIHIPPLRERRGDIEELTRHFLKKYSILMDKNISQISFAVNEALKNYPFKGNVRELENLIERAVAMEKTNKLLPSSFPRYFFELEDNYGEQDDFILENPVDLDKIVEKIEKKYILAALKKTNGNQSKAAELLNLSGRAFRYKMGKYNVK